MADISGRDRGQRRTRFPRKVNVYLRETCGLSYPVREDRTKLIIMYDDVCYLKLYMWFSLFLMLENWYK